MGDWLAIRRVWKEALANNHRALLFTIVDVDGSSYRKLGAHMIVTESRLRAGSISPGCLENDLLLRVADFFGGALPTYVSYDNRGDDVFAINQGCSGAICIRVELLSDNGNHALNCFEVASRERRAVRLEIAIDESRLYVEQILPPVRLFVFGGQDDALPVLALARKADIDCVVVDWRRDLVALHRFPLDQRVLKLRGEELCSLAVDERTAVLIMSHNYEEDKAALAAVLDKRPGYLGVMGPKKRTEQMLAELKQPHPPVGLRYPVGLDIGADTANQIAVSIVAELLSVFSATSAKPLVLKAAPIHASVV